MRESDKNVLCIVIHLFFLWLFIFISAHKIQELSEKVETCISAEQENKEKLDAVIGIFDRLEGKK